MVKAYINLEKEHEKVISCLNSYDLNSVDLGKIATQNEVHLVCTSFSMYGETKKNLSDIETASKPIPELIIANEEEFKQSIDLIKNPKIEVISNDCKEEEVIARFQSLRPAFEGSVLDCNNSRCKRPGCQDLELFRTPKSLSRKGDLEILNC